MDIIKNMHVHKFSVTSFVVFFVVALFLIYLNRKKWKEGYNTFFIFVCIICLIVYNPLFAKIATNTFLPSYLEYERTLWLIYVIPLIAYVCTRMVADLKETSTQIAILTFFVALFLFTLPILEYELYKPQENKYRLDPEAVEISNFILEQTQGKKISVCVLLEDSNYVHNDKGEDDLFYFGIRQYTTELKLKPVVITPDKYADEKFSITDYVSADYEYYICRNEEVLRDGFKSTGLQKCKETGKHILYKNDIKHNIYIVRHSETEANAEGLFQGGGLDTPLTNMGKKEALKMGEALSEEKFGMVESSDLDRAIETASLILSNNNYVYDKDNEANVNEEADNRKGVTINKESNLRDIDFGQLEGQPLNETFSQLGIADLSAIVGNVDDASFVSPYGAESAYNYYYRINRAMNDAVLTAEAKNKDILIVAHGGMSYWFNKRFPNQETGNIDNTGLCILTYEQGNWTLVDYNDTDMENIKKLVGQLN